MAQYPMSLEKPNRPKSIFNLNQKSVPLANFLSIAPRLNPNICMRTQP